MFQHFGPSVRQESHVRAVLTCLWVDPPICEYRAEVSIFMAGMDIPYNEQFLQPASAAAVYARMCLNMLHHHQQASCVREVSDLLLAALPTDRLGRSMRAVVRPCPMLGLSERSTSRCIGRKPPQNVDIFACPRQFLQ